MGADIWLGRPSQPLGYFRDSYNGWTTLNYLGLSYWQDLLPRLAAGGEFPLADNAWLLGELRRRVAERLEGPAAAATAAAYLEEHGLSGVPALLIEAWYAHIQLHEPVSGRPGWRPRVRHLARKPARDAGTTLTLAIKYHKLLLINSRTET